MYGDSITLTLGGIGGTDKVLKKINQDNYSAEYLIRETTGEIRMKVRHTLEQSKNGALALDRHNVEVTQVVFETSTAPEYTRQFYFVFRCAKQDNVAECVDVGEAVALWATGANLTALAGWES